MTWVSSIEMFNLIYQLVINEIVILHHKYDKKNTVTNILFFSNKEYPPSSERISMSQVEDLAI